VNVFDPIREIATRQPDVPALLAPGQQPLTYGALVKTVDELAARLRGHGVSPGSRVAILLPSGAGTATLSLAVMSVATCVPLNPAYGRPELASLLPRFGVTHVIAEHRNLAVLDGLGVHPIPVNLMEGTLAGEVTIESGHAQPTAFPPTDIALVLHTSGTTGVPKIVPLTHRNLLATARNVIASLALTHSDTCLNMLPMFHVGGLIDLLLAPLLARGTVACVPAMTADAFFQSITAFDPTWYQAVPTMLSDIVALSRVRSLPPTRLRLIRSVSSPLSSALHEQIETLFAVPVIEIYGMSETSGLITSNPLPPGMRKIGSVGLPAGTEVQVIDPHGNRLPPGRRGEILVRSPGLMRGYEGAPENDAVNWLGPWLRTGDEGFLDADGFLFLTGRIKEIINRGGEKISPREIDDLVTQMPGIKEAAAFALPHPTLGEEVGLAVVLHYGAELPEQVILAHIEQNLSAYKRPRRVHFVPALPRLPSGKLDRKTVHLLITAPQVSKSTPPRTRMQRDILQIWQGVLGLEAIGIDDDFFDLGGDSLKATALMLELETLLGRPVEGAILIDYPTIAGISAALEAETSASAASADDPISAEIKRQIAGWRGSRGSAGLLVGRNTAGSLPPLFWGVTKEAEFSQVATHLPSGRPVYAMRTLSKTPLRIDENSRHLADMYAEEIYETGASDPIMLGGFCQGGALAFHIAQRLQQDSRKVELLMHDSFVPLPYDGPITFFWGITGWLFAHDLERAELGWNRYHTGPRTVVELDVEHQLAYEDDFAPRFAQILETQLQRIAVGGSPPESVRKPEATLPDDMYNAKIAFRCPPLMRTGSSRILRVRLQNCSTHVWKRPRTAALPSPRAGPISTASPWSKSTATP
jgi:oxalate---CoA ligase